MKKVLVTTLFTMMIIQNVSAGCFTCTKPNENDCLLIAESHEQNSPEGTIRSPGKKDYCVQKQGTCYVYMKNLDDNDQIIGRTDIAKAIRDGLQECKGANQCYAGNVGRFEIRYDTS
ncbi:unnamed protein product [Cunninghamella blakesleeana]